ncbi:unnamed protein product [Angiostrongylus costaricensis]|uniref:AcidPPc domain-containing protein n=1 Tax=Angiostrongylus costaricensis TaxID=334426 RepID=A0A0R3PTN3_ANGCS|nr:unnamed protein product [Angiostrongylus costaricensis]
MNGVPWLTCSALALVCSVSGKWSTEAQHQLVVLNIGLLTDLCVVGVIKLTVQRRRPIYNIDDQVLEAPLFDEFSFPSGHSARAAMLATICRAFLPKYRVAVGGIAVLVAVSRVAMGRHYCSDVMGGVALGWLEGMSVLTLPVSFTSWVAELFR